jgi:hypothetical protein
MTGQEAVRNGFLLLPPRVPCHACSSTSYFSTCCPAPVQLEYVVSLFRYPPIRTHTVRWDRALSSKPVPGTPLSSISSSGTLAQPRPRPWLFSRCHNSTSPRKLDRRHRVPYAWPLPAARASLHSYNTVLDSGFPLSISRLPHSTCTIHL